jgi:uncharacterized protein (TIGR00255 family)
MKSMTGFGISLFSPSESHSEKSGEDLHLEVIIRALNGRYLEMRFAMPAQYNAFETQMKSVVQEFFERGRIDITIKRKFGSRAVTHKTIVKTEMAKLWLESYKKLGAELGLSSEPNLEMISRLPEVIGIEEKMDVGSFEKKALLEVLKKALEACNGERDREGESLRVEFLKLLKELDQEVSTFERLRESANREIKKSMLEKIERMGFKDLQKEPRFAGEVALLIDKSDISEEITRLSEHIKNIRGLVMGAKSQGKKLDFYTQELLREINTIGSKSQVAKLTQSVVEAKAIVERMREQAQNVE